MTTVTYWLGLLGLLALIIALHPFLTYPLSLALFAKRTPLEPAAQNPSAERPTLALCTCAYNEERVIVADEREVSPCQASRGSGELCVEAEVVVFPGAAAGVEFGDFLERIDQPLLEFVWMIGRRLGWRGDRVLSAHDGSLDPGGHVGVCVHVSSSPGASGGQNDGSLDSGSLPHAMHCPIRHP